MTKKVTFAFKITVYKAKVAIKYTTRRVDQLRFSESYLRYFRESRIWIFHYLMENWIRLFAGLEFLKAHPEIKIHVINKRLRFVRESIKFLGLKVERMISGNYFSKVLFSQNQLAVRSPPRDLVLKARKAIHSQIQFSNENEKQILVVERHGGRAISNHRNLVNALKKSLVRTMQLKLLQTHPSFQVQWNYLHVAIL